MAGRPRTHWSFAYSCGQYPAATGNGSRCGSRRSAALSPVENPADRLIEVQHRALDVAELVQAEQADAKSPEIGGLAAFERDAGGDLQSLGEEFLSRLEVGIVGIADHHPRRLKTFGRH